MLSPATHAVLLERVAFRKAGQGGAMDQMMPSTEPDLKGLTPSGELRPYRPVVGFPPRPPPTHRWSSTIRLSRRWLLNIGPQVDGLGSRLGGASISWASIPLKKKQKQYSTPRLDRNRNGAEWSGVVQGNEDGAGWRRATKTG